MAEERPNTSEVTKAPSTIPSVLVSPEPASARLSEAQSPRKRPASPGNLSPNLRKIASAGLDKPPRSISPKQHKRPRFSPQPMTASAALADAAEARRTSQSKEKAGSQTTSPNPAKQALGALMGMSSSSKSPLNHSAAPMSEALKTVAQSIQIPTSDPASESQAQTSPVSLSSFGTIGSSVAATAAPVSSTVESPGSLMEDAVQGAVREMRESTGDVSPEDGNKAFSYPGPHLPQHLTEPRRGTSLPHSASRQAGSRSPSAKKHKCPYCSTEFTRHHNLKSHLLTHSQEKPYVCQTCQSRFRRLHDLKRHSKLHTGERPHICPKCGRRFARGDALARHNKGPGGCAGRRSSVGSFDDGEYPDGNDESMEGLVYTEPGQMDDEEETEPRPGMPSIRKHGVPNEPMLQAPTSSFHQSRSHSTYPPIQGRPPGGIAGGLFPPPGHGGSSSSSTSPISQSGSLPFPPAPTGSLSHAPHAPTHGFTTGGITESPKPLSPGSGAPQNAHGESVANSIYRNRSSSMNAQYQHQHYGRGAGRRTPPPSVGSLPPPTGMAPQLPPPHQLNPPDPRYTLHSQGPAHPPTGPTGPPTHMSGGGLSSQSNSLSSHGQSHQGSGEGAATLYPSVGRDDRLWAYVKSLEDRVNGLQDEVTSLKSQLAIASQPKAR